MIMPMVQVWTLDTHEMTLYTERTHSMTKLFFDNLQVQWYTFLAGNQLYDS